MTLIKYPEQVNSLKEMRRSVGITATQAAEIVRTDLRNWQRWESGETQIPEAAIELFCIKNGLNYSKYARPKSDAQIEREKKRKEKFLEYQAKIHGRAQSHGLDDEDVFDGKIEGIENARDEIRKNLQSQKIELSFIDQYDDRAKKILELFKNKKELIKFVFDQNKTSTETFLADRKILNSEDFKTLPYSDKLLVKLSRNLWNGEDEVSVYDVIKHFDMIYFSSFLRVFASLKGFD